MADTTTAAPPVQKRTRTLSGTWRLIAPAAVVIIILLGWELATRILGIRPAVLPAPSRVLTAGWENRDAILANAIPTIQETLVGLTAAVVIAALVATALDFWTPLRHALLPLLVGAQSIPIIVIAPLFVLWFGFGLFPKIVVIVLATFFPLTIAIIQGFNSADAESNRLLRSMGASRWEIFIRLRLPSSLPFLVVGLRVVASFAVVAAIFSEYVGAKEGLGIYMQISKNTAQTDIVFAIVLVTILLSIALFALTYLLEPVIAPWERARKRVQQ